MFRIGTSEMAHHRLDDDTAPHTDLFGPQPKPVHPGIDHQVARPIGRDLLPPRDLLGRVEHRPRATRQRCFDIVGPDSVEHAQRATIRQRPQLRRLVPRRHKEVPAPGLGQHLGHRPRAKPIAIGLDRRPRRGPGGRRQPAPVGGQRGAIEAEAERTMHRFSTSVGPGPRRAKPSRAPSSVRRTG